MIKKLVKRLRDFAGKPAVQQALNGWMVLAWIAMIPITLAMGWQESVTYVVALSIWANIAGHLASWLTAKQENDQDD